MNEKIKIPFGVPMIGVAERNAVMNVLSQSILVHGPKANQFEESFACFAGADHAVSVSSCTAGMHLIYFALGYGPGDEVVVPAQTHVATAHAVELTGAKAVFVDAESETGNIDIGAVEAAITLRTRAIAVVHYLGVPVDMTSLVALAKRKGLFLLEDCALAIGARVDGLHVGLHGNAGVFSFYPVKHMTTAEGGMIILRDSALAGKIRMLRAFGVDRSHGERKIPGIYDTVALGFNYRMSEIHAAIGIEQLKRLPNFLVRRRENFEALSKCLHQAPGLRILPQFFDGYIESSAYCLGLLLEGDYANKRSMIMMSLENQGIGTSVYYPRPVPAMTYYREKYKQDLADYPIASNISKTILCLPVGPHLDASDMHIIANKLLETLEQCGCGSI